MKCRSDPSHTIPPPHSPMRLPGKQDWERLPDGRMILPHFPNHLARGCKTHSSLYSAFPVFPVARCLTGNSIRLLFHSFSLHHTDTLYPEMPETVSSPDPHTTKSEHYRTDKIDHTSPSYVHTSDPYKNGAPVHSHLPPSPPDTAPAKHSAVPHYLYHSACRNPRCTPFLPA